MGNTEKKRRGRLNKKGSRLERERQRQRERKRQRFRDRERTITIFFFFFFFFFFNGTLQLNGSNRPAMTRHKTKKANKTKNYLTV